MGQPDYFPADYAHADRLARASISSASTRHSATSTSTASPGWSPDTPPDTLSSMTDRPSFPASVHKPPAQQPGPYYYTAVPGPSPYSQSATLHGSQRPSPLSPSARIPAALPWQHAVSYSHQASYAGPPAPGPEVKPKRGRGRPRKLPIQDKPVKPLGQKGRRSKTGCVTCRKRKKKCDETKPTCINCHKNGKVCEGYPSLEPAEKAKAADELHAADFQSEGAGGATEDDLEANDHDHDYDHDDDDEDEDEEDTSSGDEDDHLYAAPSSDIDRKLQANFDTHANQLFPPWQHKPHAFRNVLEPLARTHKGVRCGLLCLSAQHMLQQNPADPVLQDRYRVHLGRAVRYCIKLYQQSGHSCTSPNPPSSDAYIALALIFCLAHEISGHDDFEGVMHGHYSTVAHMAIQCPQKSANEPFQSLLRDMFLSHNNIVLVTSVDRGIRKSEFKLPEFVDIDAVTLFGGARGLWVELSNINAMRQHIRQRGGILQSPNWPEDLELQTEAQSLERGLLSGPMDHAEGTPLHAAAMLYRASALVYLYRTVMPSRPHYKISLRVDEGLVYLGQLMQRPATQGVLLMPLFLLGCAAFASNQRGQICKSFDKLLEQPLNGNIQRAYRIVQAVWQSMDRHGEDSWDWEALGQHLGCALIAP